MHALDAAELDVRGRRRAGDERQRPPLRRTSSPRSSIASGTSSTICRSSTTQTWRSGTSVSARRPSAGPPARTIVPVSAIATVQPVSDAVERVELGAARGRRRRRAPRRPGATGGARAGRPTRRPARAAAIAAPSSDAGDAPDLGAVVADALAEERDPRLAVERPRPPVGARRRRRRRPAAERGAHASEDRLARSSRPLLPPLAEALARRRLQVARCASTPRAGAGSRAIRPPRTNGRCSDPRRAAARVRSVAGRRRRRPPPASPPARARSPLASTALLAQVQQHPRDVDLHRADLVAGAAQARRVRQASARSRCRCSCGVRIAPIGPG